MSLTKASYSMIAGAPINVLDYGADPTGTNDSSSAIQTALDVLGSVYIPSGTYKISADLTIKSNTCVEFNQKAIFKAGANNITFFKSNSTTNAYGSQIHNPQLDGNGFTGVVGFDMYNFRLNAGIFNPFMKNMLNGIIFRYGCFGTVIDNPTTFNNVSFPVRLMDNCGEVRISNPNFDGTGLPSFIGTKAIDIQIGATIGANIGCRVDGGYCQGFEIGVFDRGVGTQINGTYFELCSDTDIVAVGASQCVYTSTQHWASTGNSAIQAISSDGILVLAPAMASGGRTVGLLNFNNSNTNCMYIAPASAFFRNDPLGVIDGISFSISNDVVKASSVVARNGVNSKEGSPTIPTATATTIFTIASGDRGQYSVVALTANSGSPSSFCSLATVIWDGNGGRIIANNATNLTITLSGADVQVTHTAGADRIVYWSSLYQPI